ncbi:NAD(P) transhydrogenase, mitochondrial [Armadillidium nasatum]|uniref:proton-translocating NAD(P)(+) transhydrogenase n=1 Tax=Armadillidium nasatum TaxID=96803 RepID=A0A5N5T7T9_9CRUS|nr:NAD(P) transhydrogenase, mitochondrial [Armadillidium nasatum]
MFVTNVNSCITADGGLVLMVGIYYPAITVEALAGTAAFISFINIFGGFIVTQRMLDMFKRPTDLPEYNNLYGIPGAAFLIGYFASVSACYSEIHQMTYLASSFRYNFEN